MTMMKSLRTLFLSFAALAVFVTAEPARAFTQTNVLQNVALQFTIYQQGITNANGKKVSDQVTAYTTKSFITAIANLTANNFGSGPKLVLSTVYSNATVVSGSFSNVFSTNLALATNAYLTIGSTRFYGPNGLYTTNEVITISNNNAYPAASSPFSLSSDVISTAGDPTNFSVTINTNLGYVTTLTPSPGGSATVTNVAISTAVASTETVLTNVAADFDILYGKDNTLFPVDDYISLATNNSPEIVVETGLGLNTTAPLTVTNLISQMGFSLGGLNISYPVQAVGGSNILTLDLTGFVKSNLKVDDLYVHGTNRIAEDIYGANSTWNVIGSGSAGGVYLTNGTFTFLSNASPVVVQGSINISFLKNLPK
jgi:hypothetical protein